MNESTIKREKKSIKTISVDPKKTIFQRKEQAKGIQQQEYK